MLQSRRLFLSSAASLLAAPAIVQASSIMPIRQYWYTEKEFWNIFELHTKPWLYGYNKFGSLSRIDLLGWFNKEVKAWTLKEKDIERIPFAKVKWISLPPHPAGWNPSVMLYKDSYPLFAKT